MLRVYRRTHRNAPVVALSSAKESYAFANHAFDIRSEAANFSSV